MRCLAIVLVVATMAALTSMPVRLPADPPDPALAKTGQWGQPFPWRNVAIHLHVLPNGKLLYWSRREPGQGLDPHDCVPRLWDPTANPAHAFTDLASPRTKGGVKYNLFCAGHCFLPDGRLLTAGGHLADGHGVPDASVYQFDATTGSPWQATDPMLPSPVNAGRWYPTLVALADGGVLVSGGSDEFGAMNAVQQVWKDGHWRKIVDHQTITLYPRLHLAPDGRVFLAGPLVLTQLLDTTGGGAWTVVGNRKSNKFCDYAPSVMYAPGKVLYIGGGDPVNTCETIDLNQAAPAWDFTAPMQFARRQHNATILPDGTVLVTGGTQGGGFNNLVIGNPIRAAELWDPATGKWTTLAEESVDRCYHATAVLLPDGRVLSAGGGEFRPEGSNDPNADADSHRDAQIFSPPYLYRGARPTIAAAPQAIEYGKPLDITTADAATVERVTLVRLSSVTHSWNMNQRFNELTFTKSAGKVTATAPANANLCPPGHYLMFLLNANGVPSTGVVVKVN